jgi:hypothetical protein
LYSALDDGFSVVDRFPTCVLMTGPLACVGRTSVAVVGLVFAGKLICFAILIEVLVGPVQTDPLVIRLSQAWGS